MVNFHGPESVPAKFKGRTFYQHNPQVTLMRTTPAECRELGRITGLPTPTIDAVYALASLLADRLQAKQGKLTLG